MCIRIWEKRVCQCRVNHKQENPVNISYNPSLAHPNINSIQQAFNIPVCVVDPFAVRPFELFPRQQQACDALARHVPFNVVPDH